MERINKIITITMLVMFIIIAVSCLIAFFVTLMWHTLLFAAMSGSIVWAIITDTPEVFNNSDHGK